jgi:hypothetical protein
LLYHPERRRQKEHIDWSLKEGPSISKAIAKTTEAIEQEGDSESAL